jgi:hypothetical protein
MAEFLICAIGEGETRIGHLNGNDSLKLISSEPWNPRGKHYKLYTGKLFLVLKKTLASPGMGPSDDVTSERKWSPDGGNQLISVNLHTEDEGSPGIIFDLTRRQAIALGSVQANQM